MALLNYTAPFLNIPTQAPYFTQQPIHQPQLLYGVPPQDQSHPNSPYRNSQPTRTSQFTQKPQQPQTTLRNGKVQQQFFGNYDRRTTDKNSRGFPANFPKNSPQGFVKQNFEDRSGYGGDNSRTANINEQLTYTGAPGGVGNTRTGTVVSDSRDPPSGNNNNNNPYPTRPIEYTRIDPDSQKTSIHPIIDYDNDYEYYDDDEGNPVHGKPLLTTHITPLHVAPIQGPIFLKNGTIPVVPLYSYPVLNNGTFFQIPILWTALSVALGLELRGEIIRGVPCIKRYYQLFCPTAGNSYPIDRIELFIDENKALMKRMYGDFTMSPGFGPPRGRKKKRSATDSAKKIVEDEGGPPGVPDLHADPGPDPLAEKGGGQSYFSKLRNSRQSSSTSRPFRTNQSNESGRLDACESKVEILTPYWASNSAGKIRAVVNTQHFEQAIHQEVCSKMSTSRCSGDCGCEQKYKWHRLLAYDPDDDCKGIFMDWFLFPSCCVCRCNPT